MFLGYDFSEVPLTAVVAFSVNLLPWPLLKLHSLACRTLVALNDVYKPPEPSAQAVSPASHAICDSDTKSNDIVSV